MASQSLPVLLKTPSLQQEQSAEIRPAKRYMVAAAVAPIRRPLPGTRNDATRDKQRGAHGVYDRLGSIRGAPADSSEAAKLSLTAGALASTNTPAWKGCAGSAYRATERRCDRGSLRRA